MEADYYGAGRGRWTRPVWYPGGEAVLAEIVLLDADYV